MRIDGKRKVKKERVLKMVKCFKGSNRKELEEQVMRWLKNESDLNQFVHLSSQFVQEEGSEYLMIRYEK